jgi:hypothetical protein
MRFRFARLVGGLALLGAVASGIGTGAANAAPNLPPVIVCQAIGAKNAACVIVFNDGTVFNVKEAYLERNDYSQVYGVGVVCFEGQYVLIYQTGPYSSFRYHNLVKLGSCRI